MQTLWCPSCKVWKLPVYLAAKERDGCPDVLPARYCGDCGSGLEEKNEESATIRQ